MKPPCVLRVAVDAPLYRCFDYLVPDDMATEQLSPGLCILVPFQRREIVGVIVSLHQHSEFPLDKLKRAIAIVDVQTRLPPTLLSLLMWASDYYQHPIGEVIVGTMPTKIRQGNIKPPQQTLWRLSSHYASLPTLAKSAHKQMEAIVQLEQWPEGLTTQALKQCGIATGTLKTLAQKGYLEETQIAGPLAPTPRAIPSDAPLLLNPEQAHAVSMINQQLGQFKTFLLDGVTGSGKTEVYLHCLQQVLSLGKQALILVPEIGLTPQTVSRFQQRFSVPIALIHSGLTHRERLNAWLQAASGEAKIIIGTRSAVFVPLHSSGIIIVDESHDASFKQHEGFRYSARDVAVMRGYLEHIPVVLGSATPSFESLHNVKMERCHHLKLTNRATNAKMPRCHILDIRRKKLNAGLSQDLIDAIRAHTGRGNQVLIFLNRRGFAPSLMCHNCGWVAGCRHCDARMTLHKQPSRLHCHHCNSPQLLPSTCPQCKGNHLVSVGVGTERVEVALKEILPDIGIARIDRDNTQRKGAIEKILTSIHQGENQVLIGTQMLAKGHHFPDVTLVAIVDMDGGLFSSDFRAAEHMAQLLMQVAGRAGRAEKPGEVVIQTRNPDHPLLLKLVHEGYASFAAESLRERKAANLPPFSYLALIRAEAEQQTSPLNFLDEARKTIEGLCPPGIHLLGPIPSPMEKRAGFFRAQLLIQAQHRPTLQTFLPKLIAQITQLKTARKTRWSLDVDPLEIF